MNSVLDKSRRARSFSWRAVAILSAAGVAMGPVGLAIAQDAKPGVKADDAAPSAYATVQTDSSRLISPDDLVTIEALNVEEVSKGWRVSEAGDISLPMVGRIHAAGLTADQLEQELTNRLDQFVRKPQVTVFISELRGHPVTVSGAVEKPGIVQLQGASSLFDVIVQAGGPKDAGPIVTVTRSRENGTINYPGSRTSVDGSFSVVDVPWKETQRRDSAAANIPILPYDVVNVSKDEKLRRMVYVAGQVNRPGAIELITQNKVSFSQAVAMAGGFTHIASPKKTILRHVDVDGEESSVAVVNASKILAGREKDVPLRDGDIVIVPANRLAPYLETMTSTAITSSVYILGRL